MPVDANIFQQYLKAPKSVMEYEADADVAQGRKNALQLAAMDLSEKTQANQRAQSVRASLMGLGAGATDEQRVNALRATATPEGFAQADTLEKALLERKKTGAQVTKDTSQAKLYDSQVVDARLKQSRTLLDGVETPEQYMQWHRANHADPVLGPLLAERGVTAEQSVASINEAVRTGKFPELLNKSKLGIEKFTELTQAKAIADERNKTQITTTGMTNATSRANNRDTQAGENMRAGLNNDGTSNGNDDAMIDAIGQYKISPPNGMAMRNPRMQQILAKVAEKYPDFDATAYGARQGAAKSFSTGKDAQNVQAANTALNHLDTVEQLALAQKNGNMVLFNQIANKIAAGTGQAAPTNLRAAVSMVAPELTKAVVGAGGGVSERADFAHNLNPGGSPEQILGGLGTIKELLGGRLSEVERTYGRTTGRKDFRDSFLSPAAQKILAARASASDGASPAVPTDIAAILQQHGGK